MPQRDMKFVGMVRTNWPGEENGKDETRGAIITTLVIYGTKSYFC